MVALYSVCQLGMGDTEVTETTYHCQICARAIKAKAGVIAHHGYKMPDRHHGGEGSGWRTGSCYGARRLPYELGHDALDEWIRDLQKWIPEMEGRLAAHLTAPPAELTVYVPATFMRKAETLVQVRPEGFVAEPKSYRIGVGHNSYECQFDRLADGYRRTIRDQKAALSFAQIRRAEWKEPG